MRSELYIYTLHFPFGKSENFLETELPFLAKEFKKIYIYPWTFGGSESRELPENVEVRKLEVNSKASLFRRLKLLWPHLGNKKVRGDFRYQIAHAENLLSHAQQLTLEIETQDAIHYSYWLSDWATVLGLVSEEKKDLVFVSRAHGFDVYDERHPMEEQLFRKEQTQRISTVFPISEKAKETILKQTASCPVVISHLGTDDYGLGPIPNEGKLNVVSCSTVTELKRVTVIPQLLASLGRDVRWTHIGDGPEMETLKDICAKLNSSIQVELKGRMEPEAIMKLYKEEGFHFFIHLSSSEGIPVSMMEAISFGIPIIATDVGAVNEIVNEETGILLEKDNLEHWKHHLKKVILENALPTRKRTRAFWEKEFRADNNYMDFCSLLTNLD
jgi:glycosyltransferase involved in cell wall biosynthesis